MRLEWVRPEAIPSKWARYLPLLERLRERIHGFSEQALYFEALRGEVVIWELSPPEGDDVVAVFATRVDTRHSGEKVFMVLHAAGDVLPHVDLVWSTLHMAASQAGCAYGEVIGRSGWVRALARRSARLSRVVAHIPLDLDGPGV